MEFAVPRVRLGFCDSF